PLTARQAFDLACTYDSGFRRYWIDPTAGGRRPKAVQASPQRTAPVANPEDPITDPDSGNAYEGPYVTRYVADNGTLVDNPKQAAAMWLPKIRCEVLTGKHIRLLPATARDVWQADGA